MELFHETFQGAEAPGKSDATKRDLVEMLTIALLATMTGKSSCHAFELFAEYKLDLLRRFMPLKNGPPSHDEFSDLFDALDPEPLVAALTLFVQRLLKALGDDRTAIEGKAFRRAFADASKRSPLHLVQTFTPGAGLMLGQAKVDGKSNEITAMPGLLDILDLAGCTAAADAMHTQRDISARIVEKKGNYVLAVKSNQKSLHEDIKLWFQDPEARDEMASCQGVDKGQGRIGTRSAWVSDKVGWLQERHDWPGLKSVGMVEAVRDLKGRTEHSVRFFIMSGEIPPERLVELTRRHWAIGNSLHWALDIVMDEDRMRNRTGNGPECLAAIRRLALNIVRLMDDKNSLSGRMHVATMNDEYLIGLLKNAVGKF